jgi:hypothetical protein
MKDLILLLVQLVGVVSFLGGIFALMNRLFGCYSASQPSAGSFFIFWGESDSPSAVRVI